MSVGSNFSVEPVSPLPWPPYSFQSPYSSQSSHNSFLSYFINFLFLSQNISRCVAQNISKSVSLLLLLLLPPYYSPVSNFYKVPLCHISIICFCPSKYFWTYFTWYFEAVFSLSKKYLKSWCLSCPYLMLLFYSLLQRKRSEASNLLHLLFFNPALFCETTFCILAVSFADFLFFFYNRIFYKNPPTQNKSNCKDWPVLTHPLFFLT